MKKEAKAKQLISNDTASQKAQLLKIDHTHSILCQLKCCQMIQTTLKKLQYVIDLKGHKVITNGTVR